MNYIGLDGDSIGREVESYLIENDVDSLRAFSGCIVSALEEIKDKAIEQNAEVIFCTGDSILVYGHLGVEFGNQIIQIFRNKTGRTASAGIGEDLSRAYLGLKLAKAKGGNQVIEY